MFVCLYVFCVFYSIVFYSRPEDLTEFFSRYGKIADVSCPKPLKVTERPREPNVGVAFVRFDDRRDLDVALADLV